MNNTEERLIEEGRLTPRPCSRGHAVTIAKLDMDVLLTILSSNLLRVLRYHEPFIMQLFRNGAKAEGYVDEAIYHYCHQAMNELWNRLRSVAQAFSFSTRTTLFMNKAPSMYNQFYLPTFYATILSGIGPLHISDSLSHSIIIYAPEENSQYFGRSKDPGLDIAKVQEVINAMRRTGIPLGQIQTKNYTSSSQGSYFSTCGKVTSEHGAFDIVGAFPAVHYSHDDAIMAMLFGDFGAPDNPFEDLSKSVGFVDDEATIQALLASTDPTLKGATPNGPTRHVGLTYAINYFGFAPPSNTPVTGRGRGIYVLGRGSNRLGLTYLATNIFDYEFNEILRNRILHASTRVAH